MPKQTINDRDLRDRLRRHLYALMEEFGLDQRQFANRIGITEGAMSGYASFKEVRTMGLDVLVRMHRTFSRSMDVFVDSEPDERFLKKMRAKEEVLNHEDERGEDLVRETARARERVNELKEQLHAATPRTPTKKHRASR